jgi:hypothetical protein
MPLIVAGSWAEPWAFAISIANDIHPIIIMLHAIGEGATVLAPEGGMIPAKPGILARENDPATSHLEFVPNSIRPNRRDI